MSGSLASVLATFLGFGLLLTFTPCVLPMIPILSGMLARSGGQLSAGRGFALSTTYVLAMAAAYGLLGIAAAWSGQNLQAALQTPWALGAMSLLFVVLALSMFGLFELQLPSSWTSFVSGRTSGMGGSLPGAAALGFTSALIVGPCVTPPLAGALLYVSQSGDMTRGAAALFMLGLGMGLPLIVYGTVGAKALPKSGPWLVRVKQAFGVVFLGVAITMVSRIAPPQVSLSSGRCLLSGPACSSAPSTRPPVPGPPVGQGSGHCGGPLRRNVGGGRHVRGDGPVPAARLVGTQWVARGTD